MIGIYSKKKENLGDKYPAQVGGKKKKISN